MSRCEQTGRMFRIMEMLRNARNGLRLRQVAKELECCERTARRYLNALQADASFPIYTEKTDSGTIWHLLKENTIPSMVPISPEEMQALVVAQKVLDPKGENPPIAEALRSILKKLESQRTIEFRQLVQRTEDAIAVSPNMPPAYGEMIPDFDVVMEAVRRKVKIRLSYSDHVGNVTERTIAPISFMYAHGGVYLVGHCYLRDDIRQFRVDRIEHFEVLDEIVKEDINLDIEEFAQTTIGGLHTEPETVLLKIDDWMKEYFERNGSFPDQEIFEDEGELYLQFRVGPNWTLVWWLSQFGPNIEVIKPQHLRDWVADFLEAAVQQYK